MAGANRIAKEQLVGELSQKLAKAQAAVISCYAGVNVEKVTALRASLRKEGAKIRVIKNSLATRAIVGTPLEALRDQFVGPTALAYTEKDPVALAKILTDFAKQEEKFLIRAGALSGARLDKSQVEALAQTPSREVLLGRLVGSLQSPYAGLVCSLSGILRKSVYALDAIRRKKEEQGS
jgi:large subunit ribosomal protein L10